MINVAYFWAQWTGYMAATVSAIQQQRCCNVKVMMPYPSALNYGTSRPFDIRQVSPPGIDLKYTKELTYDIVRAFVDEFRPDIVVCSGWNFPPYMRVLREDKGRFMRALSMDNQWLRKPKQFAGIAATRWMLHPCFDVVFASGARQRRFAEMLGFEGPAIYEGYLACDWSLFSAKPVPSGHRRFMLAGRLVDDKGIRELLEGYRLYRNSTSDPWSLELIGNGIFDDLARAEVGVSVSSFQQPAALAETLRTAGCFILPSKFEPWGVALHEAASVGLPLITSSAVGSADHVLRHGWNGFLLEEVSPSAIARALKQIASMDPAELAQFGERSRFMASTLTPKIWAETFWTCYATRNKR